MYELKVFALWIKWTGYKMQAYTIQEAIIKLRSFKVPYDLIYEDNIPENVSYVIWTAEELSKTK